MGYTFALPWTPSIHFKYDYASGDSDPEDNKNGRFNPLFGTQNFPFTLHGHLVAVQTVKYQFPRLCRVRRTSRRMSRLSSNNASGGWPSPKTNSSGAGLQDQLDKPATIVGSELDLRLAWTVSPNLLLEGGWLYLIKGSYYSNLLNQGVAGAPNDKNTDYVFLSMRLFF